jgi:hypothetical protein
MQHLNGGSVFVLALVVWAVWSALGRGARRGGGGGHGGGFRRGGGPGGMH